MKFELLVESYKQMNEVDKKNALVKEMEKTISILQGVCREKGITVKNIYIKEILDLDNGKESLDDYLEAMFVYIMYLEEILGLYLEKTL